MSITLSVLIIPVPFIAWTNMLTTVRLCDRLW